MAQKELSSTKGLVIANNVLVVNGTNVGIGTDSPSYSLHVVSTDAVVFPVGTTAQRPAATNGSWRYNSQTGNFEGVQGGSWYTLAGLAVNTAAIATDIIANSATTQVLFNDAGVVSGRPGMAFNKSTNNFSITNTVSASIFSGASYTIGSSLVVNTIGIYHTGTMNAASFTVGSSLIANTIGVYHTGTMNAASYTIGGVMVANSSSFLHNGIIYSTSLSVSSAQFVANSLGAYHSVKLETPLLSINFGSLTANTTLLNFPSGVINAASGVFGGNIIANTTKFVLGSGIGFQANGTVGTSGQVLKTNGNTTYWGTDSTGVNQVSSGNGLTGGPITDTGTISVLANSGLLANSTGLFVNANSGIVSNSSGAFVNSSYIATISSNNAAYLGGVIASTYARKDQNNSFTVQQTSSVTSGPGFYGTSTVDHGISGVTTNNSFGGVIGFSTNTSYYGILGYINQYSMYGVGDVYATGQALFTGNVTAYFSDGRLKCQIEPIKSALDKLKEITGVFYYHNETAKKFGYTSEDQQVGVIAQDVEKVLPHAIARAPFDMESVDGQFISKSGEDYKTVMMEKLIPLIIESIKELDRKIDALIK